MELALDDDDGGKESNFSLVVTRETFEEINADLFAKVMLPLHAVSLAWPRRLAFNPCVCT